MAVPRAARFKTHGLLKELETHYEPLVMISSVMSLKEQFQAAFSKI